MDFRKAGFGLLGDDLGRLNGKLLWGGQRDTGQLVDIQRQPPQSTKTVCCNVQKVKQAWQKASMDQQGTPD